MRQYIKYFLLTKFLIIIGLLVFIILKSYNEKTKLQIQIQTIPKIEFFSLNQQVIKIEDFSSEMPLILIYFHPECDHCHYEAQEIGQNATAFENCQMIMITSDDSIPRVEDFFNKHHLWELENIDVLLDKNNTFKKTFGKAIIPSVYIYDKERRLKKQFLGETKPEAIINVINNPDL